MALAHRYQPEQSESVSDEQRVLYSAVDTVYQTYTGLLDELENDLLSGNDAAASQLYYAKVVPCGDYLSQYTLQLLETAIQDSQTTYTTISALNERITMLQTVVVALCVALGCVTGLMVMRLLTPVQQMIAASAPLAKVSSTPRTSRCPSSRRSLSWPSPSTS